MKPYERERRWRRVRQAQSIEEVPARRRANAPAVTGFVCWRILEDMAMDTNQLHVVIGATGGTGSALVRALVARGERVRAVSRGPLGALPASVEAVQGDAMDV